MRWPRFLRRRPKPPAWITAPGPTFHYDTRVVPTRDGPVTVRLPSLDDPAAYAVQADPRQDLRVIQCNYAVPTKICPAGARAYVMLTNPGGGADRIEVLARSRGGRFVRKWEDIRHLRDFRAKTIPPEHPLHARLTHAYDYQPEETAARLNEAREYWLTHTPKGLLRDDGDA